MQESTAGGIGEITCMRIPTPRVTGRAEVPIKKVLRQLEPSDCRDSPLRDRHRGHFTAILRCCNWDSGALPVHFY